MIRIRYQDRIYKSCGELRIIRFSANSLDVVLASQERSNAKEDQRFPLNVLRYDAAPLANERRKFECKVANSRTEIHHDATIVDIQRPNHIGWPLPMIPLTFDVIQRIKSLNALEKVAQDEKQKCRSHHEQCHANTIRSLDFAIGYPWHAREGNSLTQIS